MSQAYISDVENDRDHDASEMSARLSRRASLATIFGLALIAWVSVLVPLFAILHR